MKKKDKKPNCFEKTLNSYYSCGIETGKAQREAEIIKLIDEMINNPKDYPMFNDEIYYMEQLKAKIKGEKETK
jgi:hypothetical protein